eukprot:10923952-Lingulodinium_polyedra.AAC.1
MELVLPTLLLLSLPLRTGWPRPRASATYVSARSHLRPFGCRGRAGGGRRWRRGGPFETWC